MSPPSKSGTRAFPLNQPFTCVAIIAVLALTAQNAIAQHGRYLPTASGGFMWGNEGAGNNPIMFDRAVQDTTKNISAGNIRFDFDTYAVGGTGGGALSGGFFANANVQVKPGFSLIWVQTVNATNSGANEWGLPNAGAGTFPDADPMDRAHPGLAPGDPLFAPSYPFLTPAAGMRPLLPGIGYTDFPGRGFAAGNQSWRAELGLACVNETPNGDGFREVRVIDTFLWGFDFVGLPDPTPDTSNVNGFGPLAWSDPTATFLNTLNDYYDGTPPAPATAPASAMYLFQNNDNCFIERETFPWRHTFESKTPIDFDDFHATYAGTGGTLDNATLWVDPLFEDTDSDGFGDHGGIITTNQNTVSIDWTGTPGWINFGDTFTFDFTSKFGPLDFAGGTLTKGGVPIATVMADGTVIADGVVNGRINHTLVPEPATPMLLALATLWALRRRKSSAAVGEC